jgi:hypothetical protein
VRLKILTCISRDFYFCTLIFTFAPFKSPTVLITLWTVASKSIGFDVGTGTGKGSLAAAYMSAFSSSVNMKSSHSS